MLTSTPSFPPLFILVLLTTRKSKPSHATHLPLRVRSNLSRLQRLEQQQQQKTGSERHNYAGQHGTASQRIAAAGKKQKAGQTDDVMGRSLTMNGKAPSRALCCHPVVHTESHLVSQNKLHLMQVSCIHHGKNKSKADESLGSPEIFIQSSLDRLKVRKVTIDSVEPKALGVSPAMSHISASVAFFSASSSSGSSITCSCSGTSAGFLATKVFPGGERSRNQTNPTVRDSVDLIILLIDLGFRLFKAAVLKMLK